MENFKKNIEKWLNSLGLSVQERKIVMESQDLPNFKIEKQLKAYPKNQRRITRRY